jgi:hypothetical protein
MSVYKNPPKVLRGHLCDCGRPAIKFKFSYPVCARCDEIEQRYDCQHHTYTYSEGRREGVRVRTEAY